jgi:hypothetical protein
MDAFFSIKNRYIVNDTFDSVHEQIKSILERYDFSENISGKLNDDGTFKLSPRWSLGYLTVFGILQKFTYLNGTVTEEKGKTIIETTARPNYAIVTAFYLMVFVLVAKLIGINTFIRGTLGEMLLAFPILCIVLAGLMVFGAVRIRNRFERLMQLSRLE